MRLRLFWTIIYTCAFASGYAYFELHGDPCGILPWCAPNLHGLTPYQLFFMLPLFTLVSLAPLGRDFLHHNPSRLVALGTFLLAVFAEDLVYFFLEGLPIRPDIYTTQWGYFIILGIIVPVWYFTFATESALCFALAHTIERDDLRAAVDPYPPVLTASATIAGGLVRQRNQSEAPLLITRLKKKILRDGVS